MFVVCFGEFALRGDLARAGTTRGYGNKQACVMKDRLSEGKIGLAWHHYGVVIGGDHKHPYDRESEPRIEV